MHCRSCLCINSPDGARTGVNNACCVVHYIVYILVLILSLWIFRLTAQIKTKVTEEYVMPNEAPFFLFCRFVLM